MSQSRLKELAGMLARASMRTADTRKLVLHRLVAERNRFKESDPGIADCLHAAGFLVRAIGELDETSGDRLQKLTLNVLRLVGSVVKERDEPTAEGGGAERSMNDMALGEVLVQLGFVGESDVQAALQKSAGRKLGEVLIELGVVSVEDVERAASLQGCLRGKDDSVETTDAEGAKGTVRLGDLLLRNGVVAKEELDEALVHQEHTGCRIGEALVELGHANWSQIADAVMEQQRHGGATQETGETVVELD